MPEHYTKNTLEATCWCNKCNRMTQHRVDGGRRGPCLEHQAPEFSQEQLKRMKRKAKESQTLSLFSEPTPEPPVIFDEVMPVVNIDPLACPRCGKPSLKSVRAMEYGGRDRYCSTCIGDEPGEPLRWRSEC